MKIPKPAAVAFAALLLVACGSSAANSGPAPQPGVVKRDVVYTLYDLPGEVDVIAFCDGQTRVYVRMYGGDRLVVDEGSTECR